MGLLSQSTRQGGINLDSGETIMAVAVQQRMSDPRTRALVVPREHGAWGILLVPLVTGAAVGISSIAGTISVALFTLVALSFFWLRTPVESFLGAGPLRVQNDAEFDAVFRAIAILSVIASISLTALFLGGNRVGLLLLGGIAAVAFVIQAGLKKLGRRYYMAAQLIGSLGLTATAPGAYYVASGHLDSTAFALWLANWAFACNQVHFVQIRIHSARLITGREKLSRGRVFFLGQIAMAAALLIAWRLAFLPAIAALAFLPLLIRGFWWFLAGEQPLAVKRLGWTELAHAVSFGLLLIAGFLL